MAIRSSHRKAVKLLGIVAAAVVLTPLVTGYLRGAAEVGESADTTDAPYQAGELVDVLDHYRNGYTSFPATVLADGPRLPACMGWKFGSATHRYIDDGAANMAAMYTLDSMLARRRRHAEDVRADVIISDVSEPMAVFYTYCIRDSVFAPLCATRVEKILERGKPKAKRARAASLREMQAADDHLRCTFLAGASAQAAQNAPGTKP